MPRIDQFRALVAIADTGGFAAAARQLEQSPASVTRAVAALEKHFGVRMLHRTTRHSRFTETGLKFLEQARQVLGALEEAENIARRDQSDLSGELAFTAPSMFGRLHVLPVAQDFLALHRRVTLRAQLSDLPLNLIEAGLHVAVRIGELPESNLVAVRVGFVRRVVVGAPSYLAAHGEPAHPADLASHDAIGFAHDIKLARWRFRDPARRRMREYVQPRIAMVVNAQEAALDLAVRGFGLTCALSYQVRERLASGELRRVLVAFEPQPVPVHVVHAGSGQPARVREFVSFVVRRLRENPVLTEWARSGPQSDSSTS